MKELLKIAADKNETKFKVWEGKDNYQIWRVLSMKASQKSIQPLFQIIANLKNEYLIRYHACSALFKIAGINNAEFLGEVQYGQNSEREKIDQEKAINELRLLLNKTFQMSL